MRKPILSPHGSLSVRLGRWFEATATGWGVLALVVLLLAGLVVLSR